MSAMYSSLFTLNVSHSYYASNICECFQYEPQAQTQLLMQKYGIKFHPTQSGFEVLATTNQSIETYLNYISQVSDQSSFQFSTTTTTQDFYAFTEIPYNELGVLTYASDDANNKFTNTSIELHPTYELRTSTREAAIISIKFEDIIERFQKEERLQYSIQLDARKTQWNYYVIQQTNQHYQQLSIESKDAAIQFLAPEETTLQNGQEALLFSSGTTKIQLHEKVTNKLDLIHTKKTISGERKNVIINGLPIPNPMNIAVQNDHTIASLVYIYI